MADSQHQNGRRGSFESFPAEALSKEHLLEHILNQIQTASYHREIIYTGVDPESANHVLQQLEESAGRKTVGKHFNIVTQTLRFRIMPTEIHNCIQGWVTSEMMRWVGLELFNLYETGLIEAESNTTIHFPHPPYAGSTKEPDVAIKHRRQRVPPIVFETGWLETYLQLLDDMNLWLVGGNGAVKVAVIVNWQLIGGSRVSGTMELYGLDRAGMLIRRQTEVIFPEPPQAIATAQQITFSRRLLLGDSIQPGRNPRTLLPFRIDMLREKARDAFEIMGLAPA